MRLKRFGIIGMLLLLLAISFGFGTDIDPSKAAFGTSPPWVRNDHLLPGSTYEQIINLSRSDTSEDMQVKLRYDGDKELLKWMKIEDEKNLIFPKGEQIFPMKVIIKVPKRANIGDYKGGIFVTLQAVETDGPGQGGTVAIRLGSHITVEVSVTGEAFTDYSVKTISTSNINQGEPFYINVQLNNLGNTEITSLDGQVDIYNADETEIIQTLSFTELSEPIGSDSGSAVKMFFEDVQLEKGTYWLHVKALKDGEVIYENRLNQTVIGSIVPIITAEDLELEGPTSPSLPSSSEESSDTSITDDTVRAVAPVATSGTSVYLWFGIVGVAFGLIALVAVIVILVLVVRRQQQAAVQQYLARKKQQ